MDNYGIRKLIILSQKSNKISLLRSSSKDKIKFGVEQNLWMEVLTDDG